MAVQKASGSRIVSLVRTLKLIVRMNERRSDIPPSEKIYYRMLLTYCQRIQSAKAEGRPLAAHAVGFPVEILHALGLTPMHTETVTWLAAILLGKSDQVLAAAAAMGMPTEICSAHRGLAGAFALGALPDPDIMLWTSLVCDNTAKCGELVQELSHCQGFFLDYPYQHTPAALRYVEGEMRDLVPVLEKLAGHKMDPARMAETVTLLDRQINLLREICELRKCVPTTFSPTGFMKLAIVDYMFSGQPEAIEYLTTLRDEMNRMVEEKRGWLKDERHRLITLFVPPMYMLSALDQAMATHGATSAIEPMFVLWKPGKLDAAKPYEALARRAYLSPLLRAYVPLEGETEAVVQAARDWKCDGAINYAHLGCRQGCAVLKPFKDALAEIGVPVLNLDLDIVDPTSISEDDLKGKLQQFFEMLDER